MNNKINSLYELGDPDNIDKNGQWPDYLQYGFTDADVPALVELVIDPEFNEMLSDNNAVWVPLHAWRTLGQLKSTEAIQPLVDMFDSWEKNEDQWALFEIPLVMGMIGSPAIEPLAKYSKEKHHSEFALAAALEALKEIAVTKPHYRTDVLEVYRQYMSKPYVSMSALNGLLMCFLSDLNAKELIDEIRFMYEQDCIDISVIGDLEDMEIELGFRTNRITPELDYGALLGFRDEVEEPIVREKVKVGRNEPCPCGSGKKFKKCCLN